MSRRHDRVLELLEHGKTHEEIARIFAVPVDLVKKVEAEARALRGARYE